MRWDGISKFARKGKKVSNIRLLLLCILLAVSGKIVLLTIDFMSLWIIFINFAAKVLKLDVVTRLCAQVRQQMKFRPHFTCRLLIKWNISALILKVIFKGISLWLFCYFRHYCLLYSPSATMLSPNFYGLEPLKRFIASWVCLHYLLTLWTIAPYIEVFVLWNHDAWSCYVLFCYVM